MVGVGEHRLGIDRFLPYLYSFGIVALVTVVGVAVRPFVELTVITLFYVTAVLIAAVAFGLVPSLVVAVISVFAFDFFFLQPLYSLSITNPQDILSLAFFSIVAAVASGLASRLRQQGRVLLLGRQVAVQRQYRKVALPGKGFEIMGHLANFP